MRTPRWPSRQRSDAASSRAFRTSAARSKSCAAAFLALVSDLDQREWQQPSRCHLWCVHDVVRHVRDASKLHLALLHGEPPPFHPDNPFENREAPLAWLAASAGEHPNDTIRDLEHVASAELDALEDVRRTRRRRDVCRAVRTGALDGPHHPRLLGCLAPPAGHRGTAAATVPGDAARGCRRRALRTARRVDPCHRRRCPSGHHGSLDACDGTCVRRSRRTRARDTAPCPSRSIDGPGRRARRRRRRARGSWT